MKDRVQHGDCRRLEVDIRLLRAKHTASTYHRRPLIQKASCYWRKTNACIHRHRATLFCMTLST